MRKIKIFTDNNSDLIQRMVNDWLSEHPAVTILNTLQSQSQSFDEKGFITRWSLTITIFYYEGE